MSQSSTKLYEFGAFRLDAIERVLWRGGEMIVLPPKVFDTPIISSKGGASPPTVAEGSREPSARVEMPSAKGLTDHIMKFFCSQRLPGAVSAVMTGPSAQMYFGVSLA